MSELHILSFEFAQQLHIMVTWDTKRSPGCNHLHCQIQYTCRVRTPVNQVTQEDHFAALGMLNMKAGYCSIVIVDLVAQFLQQLMQLIKAAVNIAVDIKWPMLVLEVGPQWPALDLDHFNLLE